MLDTEYSGANFFSGWQFFTVWISLGAVQIFKTANIAKAGDPTNGFVQ